MGIIIIFAIILIVGILLLLVARKYENLDLFVVSLGCIVLGGLFTISFSIAILATQLNNKPLMAQYEQ